DADETQAALASDEPSAFASEAISPLPPEFQGDTPVGRPAVVLETTNRAVPLWHHGWPVPSSISPNPEEARTCIQLPEFDALVLEKARVISGRFPFAEAEFRNLRGKESRTDEPEIAHFERVFRIAAAIASVP